MTATLNYSGRRGQRLQPGWQKGPLTHVCDCGATRHTPCVRRGKPGLCPANWRPRAPRLGDELGALIGASSSQTTSRVQNPLVASSTRIPSSPPPAGRDADRGRAAPARGLKQQASGAFGGEGPKSEGRSPQIWPESGLTQLGAARKFEVPSRAGLGSAGSRPQNSAPPREVAQVAPDAFKFRALCAESGTRTSARD